MGKSMLSIAEAGFGYVFYTKIILKNIIYHNQMAAQCVGAIAVRQLNGIRARNTRSECRIDFARYF